jgi:hypothetical protein
MTVFRTRAARMLGRLAAGLSALTFSFGAPGSVAEAAQCGKCTSGSYWLCVPVPGGYSCKSVNFWYCNGAYRDWMCSPDGDACIDSSGGCTSW